MLTTKTRAAALDIAAPPAQQRRVHPMFAGLAAAAVLAVGAAPAAATPGPDSFGYRVGSVPLRFEDISKTGTLLSNAEYQCAQQPIGFVFDFYGHRFSTVDVSVNGLMTFGRGGGGGPFIGPRNQDLTRRMSTDRAVIAPLWNDWSAKAGVVFALYRQTLGVAPHRRFVTQWNFVQAFRPVSDAVTFQSVLYEGSGDIEYRYPDTKVSGVDVFDRHAVNDGGSASVGIRDTAGQTTGRVLQLSFNRPAIRSGSALLISRTRWQRGHQQRPRH